ncbi:hypothetical protein [Methylobacterium sp. WSM2598]|uniref:hypothetical protein n=1 Tax=Methylobacterium sp. WSM2598 TaxID=398261 RepID=UPI00036ACDBD|nr:hypothetical protein [Methylobacterium sp. WSM2598]
MKRSDARSPTRTLLVRTGQAAALVTILSVALTHYMAAPRRAGAPAVATAALPGEPEVTGAIGLRSDLRLDPCGERSGR